MADDDTKASGDGRQHLSHSGVRGAGRGNRSSPSSLRPPWASQASTDTDGYRVYSAITLAPPAVVAALSVEVQPHVISTPLAWSGVRSFRHSASVCVTSKSAPVVPAPQRRRRRGPSRPLLDVVW